MQHARYHRILQPHALQTLHKKSGDNDDAICGGFCILNFWRVVIIPRV